MSSFSALLDSNGFSAALGLVVGSFLNVVIGRLPLGQSISTPRSRCPKCETPIAWYDNIPVFSYLVLRGRCRKCKTSISVRYPMVELLTALLFLTVKLRFGGTFLLFIHDYPFVAILVATTFIDLDHRLIPDKLTLPGTALGLLTAYWTPGLGIVSSLSGAVLGFGLFYAIAWYYQWRTGKAGMGGGDIKFLAMLGAFLGPTGVVTTMLISSILGSVIGIAWAAYQRRVNGEGTLLQATIPYGPFLVLGGLYSYLLSEILWSPFTIPI